MILDGPQLFWGNFEAYVFDEKPDWCGKAAISAIGPLDPPLKMTMFFIIYIFIKLLTTITSEGSPL